MSLFTGVQMIGIVCSVVRAKLIALWIGPAGVALFGIFNSALEMMANATQLNLRQSSVRDISAAAKEALPKVMAAVRWWSKRLGFLGAVAIALGSPLLSLISFGDFSWWWAFTALGVAMAARSYMAGEQAIMQGTGMLPQLAKSTLWGAVGGTVVSIPMYYFWGINCIVPSIIAFALASAIGCMVLGHPRSPEIERKEAVSIGRGFVRLGAVLTISSIASTGASYIFLSYLNQEASTVITGYYQAGYTMIVQYVGMIFTALAMEYYPRLVPIASRPRLVSAVVSHEMSLLLCALVPIAVVFVSADELMIRLLYSSDFLAALPLMTIGIGGAIFRAISYCMGYVIVARGDGRIYIITEITSSCIGLALNICFYRLGGLAGLGLSYVLWYFIYCLITWVVYRHYGMRITRNAWLIIISAVIITACAIMLKAVGWAYPLAMLVPAFLLGWRARR